VLQQPTDALIRVTSTPAAPSPPPESRWPAPDRHSTLAPASRAGAAAPARRRLPGQLAEKATK
ncbi:hypothetical protein ACFU8A_42885, partial [Streptomyces sp. NPDC057546]|uniref:hypothetical protein n=1 Tax=Streptomyces sp. NPDC057546 TaxID=3346165 RepID=UPI0036885907